MKVYKLSDIDGERVRLRHYKSGGFIIRRSGLFGGAIRLKEYHIDELLEILKEIKGEK